MNRESIYQLWRGRTHPWTLFVKPALFAQFDELRSRAEHSEGAYRGKPPSWAGISAAWAPDPAATALIIDLDGVESLRTGLALAGKGYRPVVSINCCTDSDEVVDMSGVLETLREAAGFPATLVDRDAMRPAFLLDARRMRPVPSLVPGQFDNRWMLFGSDLPSSAHLRKEGITRVFVAQRGYYVQDDLVAVLSGFKHAGIEVSIFDLEKGKAVDGGQIPSLGFLGRLAWRWQRRAEIRRSLSFGRRVPEPSHG
jgi:hypothetical protein